MLGDHSRQACFHQVTTSALSSVFLENFIHGAGEGAQDLMHARQVLCDGAAPSL